jgi:8-oxo-dGTP pyrophosphatase MutT (NUDIX family)
VSSASRSRAELREDAARRLRGVLLDPAEAATLDVHGRIDAAVLVPLYLDDGGGMHAVFTRRRSDLRRHAGEISFPGGRQDDDETDLRLTALREAEEEIGLPTDAVELVGALQPTPTIATNYAVYPFVGLIEPGHRWKPSAAEVDAVLELSLRDLRAASRSAPTSTSSATTSSGAPPRGSSPTSSRGCPPARASSTRPSRSGRPRGCPTPSTTRRSS